MKRVYVDQELEMNEYMLKPTTKGPTFKYKDLISCSAMVFKCKNGYAGFHYPAQALLSLDAKYREELKEMINYIEQGIGEICSVRCFTPEPLWEDPNVEDDKVAIEGFFGDCNIRFSFADTLEEVSCKIYW